MTRIIAPIPLHDPYDYSASGPIEISMAVENLALLNAIPERKRWIGKTVYVISEEADYRLLQGITNDHWSKVKTNAAASEFWECAGQLWIDPLKKTWGFNPFNFDSPNYLPVTWVRATDKTYVATMNEGYANVDLNKTACMVSFADCSTGAVSFNLLIRNLNYGAILLGVSKVGEGAPAVYNVTRINVHIRVAKPIVVGDTSVPNINGDPIEMPLEPHTYKAYIDDTGAILSLQFNVPLEQELPADLVDAFTMTGKTFTAAQLTQTGLVGPDTILLTLDEPADETYAAGLAYDHTVAELKSWWGQTAPDFVCDVINEIPAVFVSAQTDTTGVAVVITMSRNMAGVTETGIEDSFVVSGGRTVTEVSIRDTDITLTLSAPVEYEEVVTVAFDGEIDMLSLDGTDTEAFTAQAVTNNALEPAAFASAETSVGGDEIIITMSRAMNETAEDDLEDSFTITAGVRTLTATGVSIDDTDITLTLSDDVVFGEIVSVSFDGAISLLSLDGIDTLPFTNQVVRNATTEP